MRVTGNLRIVDTTPLASPRAILSEFPITPALTDCVTRSRRQIERVLAGADRRVIAIVGPCSIHDGKAALEYADRLAALEETYRGELLILMRVYFEKPRTTVGWKGLINDPDLDGRCNIGKGIRIARRLMLEIVERRLPVATEFLDPVMPQYLADLVSWAAIGARTTESQTHREMASGLSMPVGFKNGTDGNLAVAINAMIAAGRPHSFVGLDERGCVAVIQTAGNPHGHLVLRGGVHRTNYAARDVEVTVERLRAAGVYPRVLIDCSHDNAGKDHRNQPLVLREVIKQLEQGSSNVLGVMIESNLVAGSQKLGAGPLVYGQSITDPCVELETTERMLEELATRSGNLRCYECAPVSHTTPEPRTPMEIPRLGDDRG